MRRRLGRPLGALVIMLALTGCTTSTQAPSAPETGPPLPVSWTLRLGVRTSAGLRVNGGSISPYEHSMDVEVGAAGGPTDQCYVTADAPGDGGPDRWTGEKIETRVQGRHALRNGAGAEGPYLMWQDAERRWITVQCEDEATMAGLAEQVRPERTTSLRIPLGLTPPGGYAVSGFRITRDPLDVAVSLDRLDQASEGSLYVTVSTAERMQPPPGGPTSVGGRPAFRSTAADAPTVCVTARPTPPAYVCVGVPPSDTGPRPDRTAELPAIDAIAASLRFADLDDPTTWFEADRALR